jgi:hypothetical protein
MRHYHKRYVLDSFEDLHEINEKGVEKWAKDKREINKEEKPVIICQWTIEGNTGEKVIYSSLEEIVKDFQRAANSFFRVTLKVFHPNKVKPVLVLEG